MAVFLQSVPLIANFFQKPSDSNNDDSSTIVSCEEGTSTSSVSSNVVTPSEPSFEGEPSTVNGIKEPSFPPQEQFGSSQQSNKQKMRSLTLHYGKALPVTLLSQCLLKEERSPSITAVKNTQLQSEIDYLMERLEVSTMNL